jgi:mannobiose 2-epimerase
MTVWGIEAQRILEYWVQYTKDEKYGGFYGRLDNNNQVDPYAPKGSVLCSRILWAFSAAYNWKPKEEYRDMADRAYAYLKSHFWDPLHGGIFWTVTRSGIPLDTHKQTYAQGFYLYGLIEYYKAFKDSKVLEEALEVFQILERKCKDPLNPGYFEAFDRAWNRIEDHIISPGRDKSMNTHLHVLEPYAELIKLEKRPDIRQALEDLISIFRDKIIWKDTLQLYFDQDWTWSEGSYSLGHDIETSWLLRKAGNALGKDIDTVCNTLAYASMRKGIPVLLEENGEVHWWVQAEAMSGCLFAYESTGDQWFIDQIALLWKWIGDTLICEKGEWYWGLDSGGNKLENQDKVGLWKCPYHHVRSLLNLDNWAIRYPQKLSLKV